MQRGIEQHQRPQFHSDAENAALDFDNLMEKQRLLLREMASSSTISTNEDKNTTAITNKQMPKKKNDDGCSSGSEIEEWISDWQFERVAPTTQNSSTDKEEATAATATSPDESSKLSNEGGVFYFERVLPVPTTSTADPHRVSVSSTDIEKYAIGDQQVPSSFDVDMRKDDDLFADLEAAATGSDDSEISLDDLMVIGDTMDFVEQVHINVRHGRCLQHDQNHLKSTATPSAATLFDDNDVDMMVSDEEDDRNKSSSLVVSSPKTNGTISNSACSFNSPTSVTMAQLPGPPFTESSLSVKTRPALSQMRKLMTDLMSNGNTTATPKPSSKLPCAEGMDEMYLDTLRKLKLSMERTKKSRKSLSIQTEHTQEYGRSLCVHQIVQSVQNSSKQVDTCLQSVVLGNSR